MTNRMQKIKDINKLENRETLQIGGGGEMIVYSPSDNIKNNQEKGISNKCLFWIHFSEQ